MLLHHQRVGRRAGISHRRLGPNELNYGTTLGRPSCAGGLLAPDCVFDFDGLIARLRRQLRSLNAHVVSGANVTKLIRRHGRVIAVEYQSKGRISVLECSHCIVAMGAWSLPLLGRARIKLPVSLLNCTVLTFQGRLVPHITAWLDAGKPGRGITLVPYGQETYVCDNRYQGISVSKALNNPMPSARMVTALLRDLRSAFPDHSAALQPKIHGCIKVEELGPEGQRDPSPKVYREPAGVGGLTVVFPGKASLLISPTCGLMIVT